MAIHTIHFVGIVACLNVQTKKKKLVSLCGCAALRAPVCSVWCVHMQSRQTPALSSHKIRLLGLPCAFTEGAAESICLGPLGNCL